MKIGIDARPLQHETQYRGIGKSLEHVLLSLKKYITKDEKLCFYVDSSLAEPKLLDEFPNSQLIKIPGTRLGKKRYFRSFLPSFRPLNPKPGEVDAVLQYDASFGVPKRVPSLVMFHDLIPVLFRGQEKQRPVKGFRKAKDMLARKLYWNKYLRVLNEFKYAARIAAISQSSKKDLLKYLPGIKEPSVSVIYLGINHSGRGQQPSRQIKQLAMPPYLLYVGGIDIRKNIVELLKVFYELKPAHPDLRLILVGKEFELKPQLKDLGWFSILNTNKEYAKDVINPGYVSAADLAYIYKTAAAFVFPSRYEGFGLPVLEAMDAGCPVVAYNNSSIPEVAGDAALLVPDGQPLDSAIEKVLNDAKLRDQLVKKGGRRAALFSWDETAKQTLDLLREIANKSA